MAVVVGLEFTVLESMTASSSVMTTSMAGTFCEELAHHAITAVLVSGSNIERVRMDRCINDGGILRVTVLRGYDGSTPRAWPVNTYGRVLALLPVGECHGYNPDELCPQTFGIVQAGPKIDVAQSGTDTVIVSHEVNTTPAGDHGGIMLDAFGHVTEVNLPPYVAVDVSAGSGLSQAGSMTARVIAHELSDLPEGDHNGVVTDRFGHVVAVSLSGTSTSNEVIIQALLNNMPIFPEAKTANGKLVFSSVVGQVVLAEGQIVVWRGFKEFNTSELSFGQRTLAVSPNKTYHVRLNRVTGLLSLNDLADVGYNPTAFVETDRLFDTTYDDALLARVVTNGSNVPAVTTLINKPSLFAKVKKLTIETDPTDWGNLAGIVTTLDWSRTPMFHWRNMSVEATVNLDAINHVQCSHTRYAGSTFVGGYSWIDNAGLVYNSGSFELDLTA